MFNVKTLNKISPVAVNALGAGYNVADDIEAPEEPSLHCKSRRRRKQHSS